MSDREKVFGVVCGELDYQNEQWPARGPEDVPSVGEEILLLEEYVAQARKA